MQTSISSVPLPAGASLISLPEDFLVPILAQLDGPTLDKTLHVSKHFTGPTNRVRALILRNLFKNEDEKRRTDEKMPTRLELSALGYRHPNMRAVLNVTNKVAADRAMKSLAKDLPAIRPVVAGSFRKNAEALASIQLASQKRMRIHQRITDGAGGEPWYEAGQFNRRGLPHGFIVSEPFLEPGELPRPERYEGNFVNGRKQGLGYEIYPNGMQYEGTYENGVPHGQGSFVFSSDHRYDGELQFGKAHGEGSYVDGSSFHYKGAFQNNVPHGQGRRAKPDGTCYEGMFENDLEHGHGKMTYANGDVYDGGFRHGKRHGLGKHIFAEGSSYEGAFAHDLFNGQGRLYQSDGSRYTGEFADGQIHGRGEYVFNNCCRYEGGFKNVAFHGYGTLFNRQTGERHEGFFVNGRPHGYGESVTSDGIRYLGGFENGREHGQGIVTSQNGRRFAVNYAHGTLLTRGAL